MPTADQIKWSVPAGPIVCSVYPLCKSLGIFIRISMILIRHVHLDSSGQRMYHTFRCVVFLWSIGHGSSLFVAHDPIKRTKEIRHKSYFSIVMDCFTRAKLSEHTFLLILRDRLRGPDALAFVIRYPENRSTRSTAPCSLLTIAAKKEYDSSPESETVTLLASYLASHTIAGAYFTCLSIHTLSQLPLDTSIQTSSVKLRSDPLISSAYSLVFALQTGMILMQKSCFNSSGITNRTRSTRSSDFVADLGQKSNNSS